MFSLAQALRLLAPIPPTPIAAIFSFPDGDCPAKTCRGAIAAATAASPAVEANSLRVMARFDRAVIGSSCVRVTIPDAASTRRHPPLHLQFLHSSRQRGRRADLRCLCVGRLGRRRIPCCLLQVALETEAKALERLE